MHHRLARFRRAAVASGPVALVELAVMTGVLAALAAVTFGRHVLDGGFYSDDWSNAAAYRFGDSPRFLDAIDDYADLLGSRPLLAVLLPLPHALLGGNTAAHLALALVLGISTCVCFYLFLRAIPIAPVHAGAIAALALVFPWADSVRLWATASLNTVALCFAFLGAFVALRGIERSGKRSATALWFAALLYSASVLTYEVAGVALLLVGALYMAHAPRPKALRWWAVHAGVVAGALVYTALTTAKDVGTIGDRLGDLPSYTRQAIALLSHSFVPPGTTSTAPRLLGLAVAAAIVVAGVWRYSATRDHRIGFWLAFLGAAVVTVVSAYLVTLGAFLEPLREGVANRGNLFAAFGLVSFVYALGMTAVALAMGNRLAGAATALAIALVAVGYIVRARDDAADWDRAARLQQPVIDAAARAASRLPRGASVFTFGYPSQVSEDIPIFYVDWDLDGALALELGHRSYHAYPVYTTASLVCDNAGITVDYRQLDSAAQANYDAAFFLDVPTGAVRRVTSVAECAKASRVFRSGAEFARSRG